MALEYSPHDDEYEERPPLEEGVIQWCYHWIKDRIREVVTGDTPSKVCTFDQRECVIEVYYYPSSKRLTAFKRAEVKKDKVKLHQQWTLVTDPNFRIVPSESGYYLAIYFPDLHQCSIVDAEVGAPYKDIQLSPDFDLQNFVYEEDRYVTFTGRENGRHTVVNIDIQQYASSS